SATVETTTSRAPIVVTTPNDVKDSGDGYTSLREAYAAARNGDTIVFDLSGFTGQYDVEGAVSLNDTLTIQKSITIDGQVDGGANIVVDGKSGAGKASGYYRILTVGNKSAVSLNNLTLQNGKGLKDSETNVSGDSGGAVYVRTGSDVTLNYVTLKNNSGNNGGAISIESSSTKPTGATLTVVDCRFEDNNAHMKAGGAIYIVPNSTVTVTDTTFVGNYANSGGAISVNKSEITLTNGVFEENHADGQSTENAGTKNGGGALYAIDSAVTVDGATFADNKATNEGGGFKLVGADSVGLITNSTFTSNLNDGNTQHSVGGAIYLNEGELEISESTFSNNGFDDDGARTRNGGAIYVQSGKLTTSENASFGTLTGNAAQQGGAVYVAISQSGDVASVQGATFEENEATEGGAVYVYSGPFSATGGSFEGNVATTGGAIYVGSNSNVADPIVTVDGVAFSGNEATEGGAIYVWRGSVAVEGGEFNENVAKNGGAIYNRSETTLSNASFVGNIAESGGAAYAASGTIAADKNVFEANVATKYGGAVYV
ncbi:MAG: hypothetical protein J6X44_08730, partial [Thermoguttaceae bacterium]|nr:hypothetical protein [Thermoguttaceae bacterium]